jgi:hypothetical protein
VRIIAACILVAAISAPLDVSAADPLNGIVKQLNSFGRRLTQTELCQLALLAMASRYADEQTRMALNEMLRNRGCHEAPPPRASPSIAERARVAVCRTIPDLLFQPGMRKLQKRAVMEIAKANGCNK